MALTADRNTQLKDGEVISVPVKAAVKIFAGSLVVANAGYAAPGTTAAGLIALGRAEEAVDNTGGADGAKNVLVRRKNMFKWANSGGDPVVAADIGALCYIVDDLTVCHTLTGKSVAGKVLGIEPDGVWVE